MARWSPPLLRRFYCCAAKSPLPPPPPSEPRRRTSCFWDPRRWPHRCWTRSWTPDFAFQVAAVVTQPPAAENGGRKLMPSAVVQLALDRGFPGDLIFTPERAGEESFLSDLMEVKPKLCITAAYGNILPQRFLDIPPCAYCGELDSMNLPRERAGVEGGTMGERSRTGVGEGGEEHGEGEELGEERALALEAVEEELCVELVERAACGGGGGGGGGARGGGGGGRGAVLLPLEAEG